MEFHAMDGRILVRLICGLFLFPHFYHKLTHFNDEALRSDYEKSGWKPPAFFMGVNMAIESICGILLIIGFQVKWAALVVAALMFAAAGSVPRYNPKGFAWVWAAGGIEYCVFWGLICIALAWLYW